MACQAARATRVFYPALPASSRPRRLEWAGWLAPRQSNVSSDPDPARASPPGQSHLSRERRTGSQGKRKGTGAVGSSGREGDGLCTQEGIDLAHQSRRRIEIDEVARALDDLDLRLPEYAVSEPRTIADWDDPVAGAPHQQRVVPDAAEAARQPGIAERPEQPGGRLCARVVVTIHSTGSAPSGAAVCAR